MSQITPEDLGVKVADKEAGKYQVFATSGMTFIKDDGTEVDLVPDRSQTVRAVTGAYRSERIASIDFGDGAQIRPAIAEALEAAGRRHRAERAAAANKKRDCTKAGPRDQDYASFRDGQPLTYEKPKGLHGITVDYDWRAEETEDESREHLGAILDNIYRGNIPIATLFEINKPRDEIRLTWGEIRRVADELDLKRPDWEQTECPDCRDYDDSRCTFDLASGILGTVLAAKQRMEQGFVTRAQAKAAAQAILDREPRRHGEAYAVVYPTDTEAITN